ncbi:MAG: hypothetical protein KKG47_13340 [Proteobacteria bacterium]|nr:hypothetical protein [Pseudomonadota bacterium]MBU1737512.1 hypothetical protein [Pseudomonadota bacterium]
MRRCRTIAWLLILSAGLLLGSCGRKTRPVPPQSVVPARITDLRAQADDTGITLSWSWPDRTEQGGRLKSLSHFLVEKAVYRADESCRECPIAYSKAARITGGTLPADAAGRRASFRDLELQPGHRYYYRVFSSMGWNVVSLPSDPVSQVWRIPLASPAGFTANAGDGIVSLSWQAVNTDIDGQTQTGTIAYRIYRTSGDGQPVPLGEPMSGTEYHDRRVVNGTRYRYLVMATHAEGGGGRFSELVEATPSDLTPPPAPRGLKAIRTSDGTSLFWDPVFAEDLAGYLVFRRNAYRAPEPGREAKEEQDLDYIEIGSVKTPATSFTDHHLPEPGSTWNYTVKSFDTANPPNLSPFSWEVKIKRERQNNESL